MEEMNDSDWVRESVIQRAFETGTIVRSGSWCADPVEGKDSVKVYRFEEEVERDDQDN